MRLYLLPGLGADPRMYRNLDCGPQVEVIALPWIDAEGVTTMAGYASLLHNHYGLEPPYALGGVSIGGMIAQEWARIQPPESLVLISTATDRQDMALLLRMASGMPIGALLNKPFLTTLGVVADRFTTKSKEGRALFLEMLQQSDADFLHFGAQAVLDWQPPGIEVPTLRIHGTNDKVFPYGNWEGCHVLEGGNHFMIFDRGIEIGEAVGAYFAGRQQQA